MKLTRLTITGFKSFADATDIAIAPGLTGVVGPNGCGKSNVLEALRWVMGAASAKALRAGGMEDVIFSGSEARTARNHAEVTLHLDNSARDAPPALNTADTLAVSRRITRGAGSTYRVNGTEVRARDVALLFADAATGANSPALVRQGQVSELINAKPENRRRVLEEAAGISGLRARRREAELKLTAAEANLATLDDETGAARRQLEVLRRQARQAQRYRALSQEISTLEHAVARRAWREAAAAEAACAAETNAALAALGAARSTAEETAKKADALGDAVEPLRAAAQAAAMRAATARAARDARTEAIDRAIAETEALAQRLKDAEADQAREEARRTDASDALARLEADGAQRTDAPDADTVARLQDALSQAAARLETDEAAARAATSALAQARADAEARVRALKDAEASLARAHAALTDLGPPPAPPDPRACAAAAKALKAAESTLAKAQKARETARAKRQSADAALNAAQAGHRAAQVTLAGLEGDCARLAAASAAPTHADPAIVGVADLVQPAAGYERAVAAALGEAGEAPVLDGDRPGEGASDPARAWRAMPAPPTSPPLAWPEGVEALSAYVRGPAALDAVWSHTGVVADAAAGHALHPTLSPGQQLVSLHGGLWRWDGYLVQADAPGPVAQRLEARAALGLVQAKQAQAQALCAQADTAREKAQNAAHTAQEVTAAAEHALEAARTQHQEAERALRAAEDAQARQERTVQAFGLRQASAHESLAHAQAQVESARARMPDPAGLEAAIGQERACLVARDEAAHAVRAAHRALDAALQAQAAAQARAEERAREHTAWRARLDESTANLKALAIRHADLAKAHKAASEAPARLQADVDAMAREIAEAEAEASRAHEATREADHAARDGDRRARAAAAESAQAEARYARAQAAQAQAHMHLTQRLEGFRERFGRTPGPADMERADSEHAERDSAAKTEDLAAMERRLERLRGERDGMGEVNLTAQDEADQRTEALSKLEREAGDLQRAIGDLRKAIDTLNGEARTRMLKAFQTIDHHFQELFQKLFEGGEARLALVDDDDPLEAGLDIHVSPPGKRLGSLSLMSGGEQALTATALIFAVFMENPAPVCALDEVDAPLDDANVDRFCTLLEAMRARTETRFVVITHHPVTMSRMDRLYGVTMAERGVSQLVSVDLTGAENLVASA